MPLRTIFLVQPERLTVSVTSFLSMLTVSKMSLTVSESGRCYRLPT